MSEIYWRDVRADKAAAALSHKNLAFSLLLERIDCLISLVTIYCGCSNT